MGMDLAVKKKLPEKYAASVSELTDIFKTRITVNTPAAIILHKLIAACVIRKCLN